MDFEELKSRFENPPKGYGPVPFWSVNSTMDVDTIRRSLEDQNEKGFEEVIIHPRSGFEVEYFSDEYWTGMDVIISELIRLDMKGWLYDEYNWPSGVAGGILLREHPEYGQRGLNHMIWRRDKSIELKGPLVAAFDIDRNYEPLHDQYGCRTFIPPRGSRNCLVFWHEYMADLTMATTAAPWAKHELGMLDYLNADAVDYFMELTHREYERRYSDHFGKTLVGMFTDEPQNYRGLPWCSDMLEQFEQRNGYDLLPVMHHLVADSRGSMKTRCDFYRVAGELYRERFYGAVGQWCEDNGLIFTGHLGMEEGLSLMAANHGSVYPALAPMQMPGIDILGIGHAFSKGLVNAEVPNFSPKMISSIAHLNGRKRCLVELWGGGGWKATPARLKKALDWMLATGVNFINPHLVWVSAKGLRKRDFPQSFSPQQPWWDVFAPFSKYISRMSALLSEGTHQARVLLLFPITSIHAASKGRGVKSKELGDTVSKFKEITDALLLAGHDFDYLFEEAIDMYRVEKKSIAAGDERFDVVVIPEIKCLAQSTVDLLKEASAAGVKIACAGDIPSKDDTGADLNLAREDIFDLVAKSKDNVAEIVAWLDKKAPPAAKVSPPRGRVVLTNHRRIDEMDVVFVTDITDNNDASPGPIGLRLRGMGDRTLYVWNPDDASEIENADVKKDGDDLTLTLRISPGQSVVVAALSAIESFGIRSASTAVPSSRKIVPLENWTRKPRRQNVYLVEPCIIKAPPKQLKTLKRLRLDRRLPVRAKLIALLARGGFSILRRVKPPEKKYRYERFFDFGDALDMSQKIELYLGIPMNKLGPYEGAGLLIEWADYFDMLPNMGKAFPDPGAEYTLESTVKMDYIPDDIALVYEELGEKISIHVNGKHVELGEPTFLWDECNRSAPLAEFLKKGPNKIVFESRIPDFETMYPTVHAPEPLALAGSFHVKQGRITNPAEISGPLQSWTDDGLPFYSGPVSYRCKIEIEDDNLLKAVLELGEVKEVVEVNVNGKSAGVRLWPPYDLDIAPHLTKGENEIEVVVRNTAANFFHKPRKSGLLGPVKLVLDSQ